MNGNGWIKLDGNWRRAMKFALGSCGIDDELEGFEKLTGSRSVDIQNGERGYIIFGLEFENPSHRQERDVEMKVYQRDNLLVAPFEDRQGRFSGFKVEVRNG